MKLALVFCLLLAGCALGQSTEDCRAGGSKYKPQCFPESQRFPESQHWLIPCDKEHACSSTQYYVDPVEATTKLSANEVNKIWWNVCIAFAEDDARKKACTVIRDAIAAMRKREAQ